MYVMACTGSDIVHRFGHSSATHLKQLVLEYVPITHLQCVDIYPLMYLYRLSNSYHILVQIEAWASSYFLPAILTWHRFLDKLQSVSAARVLAIYYASLHTYTTTLADFRLLCKGNFTSLNFINRTEYCMHCLYEPAWQVCHIFSLQPSMFQMPSQY